jgi:hypothetical protein
MRSAPAIAPVCDTAAWAPASERPILNATTGLPARAAFSAAARNLSRVAHRFDIERDDPGGLVVGQVVDEVGQFQIDLVAGGDQFGQADAARRGARQQRAQDAAALRHHPDAAHREVVHLQRAAGRQHDVVGEVDQADGVGSQDAHRAGGFDQLLLAPGTRLAGFGVAAGQHDGGGGAARRQFAHRQVRPFGA